MLTLASSIDEHSGRQILLVQAAADFFHFQNRRYPRRAALEWVGNRYELNRTERHMLHRGVFGQWCALSRKARCCKGADWRKETLVVDGHNVHITLESAILGRPLLKANDGALRDLAGQSSGFRLTEVSETAMAMVLGFLERSCPRGVVFLFDAPMSRSGLLASKYREGLKARSIPGEAEAVPVPEKVFAQRGKVVASSDGAVLEEAPCWFDLACRVLDAEGTFDLIADFSSFLLTSDSPCLLS